jgi:hypothetical protein
LLVGAFPYPQNHGSQIYFQEQAIALRSLGAEVTLLTYGSGRERPRASPSRSKHDEPPCIEEKRRSTREIEIAEYWRSRDGFEHLVSSKWTSPASLRSGPSWAKPLADFGLAMTLRNAIASRSRHDMFDAILTHNAEATLVALHLLPGRRPPIIYCAHTLLGSELSAYLKGPKNMEFLDHPMSRRGLGTVSQGLDQVGSTIDRSLARRVDGWIVLTRSAEHIMRHFSDAPGALIAPPVPDPLLATRALDPDAAARAHGLEPGRFFLYSGNLDAYQEIDILAAAARRRESQADAGSRRTMRLVIASHSAPSNPGWLHKEPEIEFLQVESSA